MASTTPAFTGLPRSDQDKIPRVLRFSPVFFFIDQKNKIL